MSRKRLSTIVILAIIAAYILLRLWRLSDSCLWFDEIFSVHAAEQPWGELFRFVALDLIHPPLFYVRLKLWVQVVGDGVFWLRLLPVIISCLAIAPFLLLCRELKLKFSTTALALFLLAVNGSLIKYAQEVRMYSLLMCLSLFSMWLFIRYLNRGKGFIWLVIVNILLIYSHYFGWLVIGSELAAALILHRRHLRRTAIMAAACALVFLPWAIAVVYSSQSGSRLGQNLGWMSRPGFTEIVTFVFDVIEPFYHQSSSGDPESFYPYSLLILLLLAAVVTVFIWKFRVQPDEEKFSTKTLLIFIAFPIIAAFSASWLLPYSVWGIRHLILIIAPVTIIISVSFTALRPKALPVLSMVLFGLFAFIPFVFLYIRVHTNTWCGWDRHTAKLEQTTDIYAAEELIAYHIWFARRGTGQRVFMVRGLEGVTDDPAYFLPRGFDEVKTVEVGEINARRIAVAFRGGTADEGQPPLTPFSQKGYRAISISQGVAGPETTNVVVMER